MDPFDRRPSARGARGGALPDFLFLYFPCSADHERDWPPCEVVFFGLATNALNSHAYSKSMGQPGKVANPARGQLNREN